MDKQITATFTVHTPVEEGVDPLDDAALSEDMAIWLNRKLIQPNGGNWWASLDVVVRVDVDDLVPAPSYVEAMAEYTEEFTLTRKQAAQRGWSGEQVTLTPPKYEYRARAYHSADLSSVLNEWASEGWRVHTVTPMNDAYMVVVERVRA
jgi:hypothetical protein